jgi:hypothetical protein
MVPIPTPADKEKSEDVAAPTTTITNTDEPLKPDELTAAAAAVATKEEDVTTGGVPEDILDHPSLEETPGDLTIPGATTTAAAAAVTKKAKAESKEGPMGELRPTDILAGNYRKRAGNYLYKKLLREHAPDVGKVEMRILVAKVVEGIAGQDPPGTCFGNRKNSFVFVPNPMTTLHTHTLTHNPYLHFCCRNTGRFIREGGDALLSAAQRNQKVARALREVAERSTKDPDSAEGKTDKVAKKPKTESDKNQEPIGEIRPSDVLTGNYRKRPGNYLYKKLLRDEAPNVAKEEMRAVVNRVIEGVYAQIPPGRFIREGGGGLLTRGQIHQKVARALREVVERTGKEGEDNPTNKDGPSGEKVAKKKSGAMEKQEPMGEIRPTDVLTGNYRKRAGNALYKKLLRECAPAVGKEEMGVVVSRVVDGISGQEPPGRFIREGGGALLTRGQVRQKVARALREVVERTKSEKEKPSVVVPEAVTTEVAAPPAPVQEAVKEDEIMKEEEKVEETKEEEVVKEEDVKGEEEEEKVEEMEEEAPAEEPKKKRGKKEEAKKEEPPKKRGAAAVATKEEPPTKEEPKKRGARKADTKEEPASKPPAKRGRKK